MSNDNKTTPILKDNKSWNMGWNIFWMVTIFLLCLSPIFFIYSNNAQRNKNYIEENLSKNRIYICRNKTECQVILQKTQQIQDKIYKNIENTQIQIDNQDKIINSLTFSVSLYAVLITVISIFFSLRESQRIDKALDEINEFKENLSEQLSKEFNKKQKELNGKFEKKFKKLKSDFNEFEDKYNKLEISLSNNKTEEKNEEFVQQPDTRDTDIDRDDIDNSVLQNETNGNNTNKNELNFESFLDNKSRYSKS